MIFSQVLLSYFGLCFIMNELDVVVWSGDCLRLDHIIHGGTVARVCNSVV